MTVNPQVQVWTFAASLLAGIMFGLAYDLLRQPRRRGPKREFILDAAYWLIITISIVVAANLLGDGEIRLYMLLAHFLGAVSYFCYLSPAVRILLTWLEAVTGRVSRLLARPFTWVAEKLTGPLASFFLVLGSSRKKLFSFWAKWFKMIKIPRMAERILRRKEKNSEECQQHGSQKTRQDQKGWSTDENCHLCSFDLPGDDATQPPRPDR